MEIFEREDVLQRVSAAYLGWPKAGGLAFVLAGEAGIGKSATVETFIGKLTQSKPVFRGYCDRGAGVRRLGPFYDFAETFDSRFPRILGAAAQSRHHLPAVLEILKSRQAIIILEDLHNADDASLGLLQFILRRLRETPLFLILTLRDSELSPEHPLAALLGSVASDDRVVRLQLQRLSLAAVAAAAKVPEGDPVAQSLFRRSGGNPFLMRALIQADMPDDVPPSYLDLVRAQLAGLTRGTRDFLLAAAIQRSLDPSVMRSLFGPWNGHETACVRAGLLERRGQAFNFPHELTREAVLSLNHAQSAQELHGRILDALLSDGLIDPDRLAHHAIGAGRRQETCRWAIPAARAALARGALREAADYARSALRLISGQNPETAELHEVLSGWHEAKGMLDAGLEDLASASRIWKVLGQTDRVAACLAKSAIFLVRLGRNREADEAAASAVVSLEGKGECSALVTALTKTAYLAMLDRDGARCLHFGHRAIKIADRLGESELSAEALMIVGTSLIVSDDHSGQPLVERAIQIGTAEGKSELVARCFANLGSGYGEQMRFAQARAFLDQGLRYAADRDLEDAAHYMAAWLSLVELRMGQLSAARERAQALLAVPNMNAVSRIMALVGFGHASVRLGLDGADTLDTAVELARTTGALQRIAPACLAAAELALQSNDMDRVRRLAQEVHDLAIAKRHAWFSGEAQLFMLRSGIDPPHTPWIAAPLRQEISGDVRGAAHNWASRGCPFEQARALSAGDTEARQEALAIFEGIGARPAADALRRILRRAGVRRIPMRPRGATTVRPGRLTPRQGEVANYLCAGLTDAEIAEVLKVSTKTVGHHVSAVLDKLDVRSRHHVCRVWPAKPKESIRNV